MNKIASNIKALRLLLTGLLFLLAFSQIAHANLVSNPFFTGTTAAATGWTSSQVGPGSAFNHSVTVTSGAVRTAPPAVLSGKTEFYSGCNNANCLINFTSGTSSGAQQAITTVVGTAYTLSFWIYSSGTGAAATPTEIDVYWGASKVYAGINVTPAGWSLQTITLPAAAVTSTNLTVLIRDDPDYSAITFMDVEPIVLRLAKTNPANLAVGVPANYSFSINNISTTASGTSFQLQDQLPPNIQYNSVAFGAGLTGASCVASGTVAAGQLLTCTITTAAGGIPVAGSGALTINVTPQAASANVASVNKASVQYNGGVVGVAASASMVTIATPSTCTGADSGTGPAPVFGLGCAVAASITPTAAQLAFSKTVNVICDPINGSAASGAKNIPGAAVQYALNVANTGTAVVVLSTVTDLLQLVGPSGIVFDPKLNSGALPATNCVSGNVANTLSATGFSAVSGVGVGPGPAPTTATPNAVTVGATAAGQTVTIKYSGAGLIAGTGIPGWTGTLGIGNYITVYFNAFVQ